MTEIRASASTPATLPPGTLLDLFLGAVDRFPSGLAFRYHSAGEWRDVTFGEALTHVREVTGGLSALGIVRGDKAAVLSPNRPEWAYTDYGCLALGVVDIPIYVSLTARQIAYILNDAGIRILFLSDAEQLAKIQEVRGECPALEWVVIFDPPPALPERTLAWTDFIAQGAETPAVREEQAFRAEAGSANPEDTATILYTSGTTGDPKGVMLSHRNLHANVQASLRVIPSDDRDSTLSFLPLSHVFQRMVDYLFFSVGATIAYARSMDSVAEDLREIRPTIVVSVPRLYEKVYAKVTAAQGVKGALVSWASRVGARWSEAVLAGRTPDRFTAFRYGIARRLVFSKVAAAVGGRLRFFVSGGAPLSPEINRFFFAAGVLILEGYGLTETSPTTNVNSPLDFPANFRIGTVGKPLPGTEIAIAEDGEILVRGPQVMKGYYNNPKATREAIGDDGWFRTGDVGEIDGEGFLRITDRKKDIIVTAGGKNIAPQPIENRLKQNRYVDQAVLLGDRRKFISLLLVPDFPNVEAWAAGKGIPAGDRRALLTSAPVQAMLWEEIEKELQEVSRVERPKKVVLLEHPFTIEDGSLTPTQKVKRKVVEERHRGIVDALYDEANEATTFFPAW